MKSTQARARIISSIKKANKELQNLSSLFTVVKLKKAA